MRTDIPAFYSRWLINRIREGYVLVRNPYSPSSVTRYAINPSVVDLIAFCTKNPLPMLDYMDHLEPYAQYWFVTITPYEKEIEPNVPDKENVIRAFCCLSDMLGKKCVAWRYDPVFISEKYSLDFHLEAFEKMAFALSGYTETCVISFIDIYRKVRCNFPQAKEVSKAERLIIGSAFAEIGRKYGMRIKACAEGTELEDCGVDCRGCLTKETYEKAIGRNLILPKRNGQRKECACFFGSDIGSYDTCKHLCAYCYANADKDAVLSNSERHDESSPLLIGGLRKTDEIHDARQESWISNQLLLGGIV